jgi:hypothetical protein
MFDTEAHWRAAAPETKVCTITGTTKNMVLSAIMDGAKDFETLSKKVALCGDNECAKNNPSGRGCRENAEALLSIYVPVYELMTENGGCSHVLKKTEAKPKPDACSGEKSAACGGCSLCG